MRNKVYDLLIQKNLDVNRFNIDKLQKAGMDKILDNIEFYYDKPYTCESVFKELFNSGIMEEINRTQLIS